MFFMCVSCACTPTQARHTYAARLLASATTSLVPPHIWAHMGTHDDAIQPPGSVTTITNSVRARVTRTSVCFSFLMFDVPSACARMQTEPRVHAHAQFVIAPDELRHLWKSELHVRRVLKKSTVHVFFANNKTSAKSCGVFRFMRHRVRMIRLMLLRSQQVTRQGRTGQAGQGRLARKLDRCSRATLLTVSVLARPGPSVR